MFKKLKSTITNSKIFIVAYSILAYLLFKFITLLPVWIEIVLNLLNVNLGWNMHLDPQITAFMTTQTMYFVPIVIASFEVIRMYIDKFLVHPIQHKIQEYKSMGFIMGAIATAATLFVYHFPTVLYAIAYQFMKSNIAIVYIQRNVEGYETLVSNPIVMAIVFVPLLILMFDLFKDISHRSNLPLL